MLCRTASYRWTSGLFLIAAFLILAIRLTPAQGPCQSCIYQQSAQVYRNGAAQCQNPQGRACMLAYAAYNDCLAAQFGSNARSCTPPTCSTACPSSNTSGGGSTDPLAGATPSNSAEAKAQAYTQLAVGIIQLLTRDRGQRKEQETPVPLQSPETAQIVSQQNEIDQQARREQMGQELVADLAPGAADEAEAASPFYRTETPVVPQVDDLALDASIVQQPDDTTSAVTQDWQTAMNEVRDTAVEGITPEATSLPTLMQSGADQLADKIGSDSSIIQNPLQSAVEKTYQDLLDTGAKSDSETFGSILKDKAVNVAAEKTADYLLDHRDKIACAENESGSAEMADCRLVQAANPVNITLLGLKTYLNRVMSRFFTLWDTAIPQITSPLQ